MCILALDCIPKLRVWSPVLEHSGGYSEMSAAVYHNDNDIWGLDGVV